MKVEEGNYYLRAVNDGAGTVDSVDYFLFDHLEYIASETIIDGTKGGNVRTKMFSWVELIGVNSI